MQSRSRAPIISAGLLFLAGLAAYHNSLSGPFVLDDTWVITGNPSIRHLWPPWGPLFPPPDPAIGARPLYNLSLAVNYALGGTAVRGYHVLNLAIHLLAGLTLFGILRRTLKRVGPAFAIALIWMVHPLLTESVTYIAERSESLAALFYLQTLYWFIRSVDRGSESGFQVSSFSPQPSEKMSQVFSIASCLCCVATKEVSATLPIAVLLYDRTFVAGTFREAWARRSRYYLGLCASWVLLAVLMSRAGGHGVGFGQGVSAAGYAATECSVVLRYLRLALWPSPLVFDYDLQVGAPNAAAIAPAILVLLLVAASAWALWQPLTGDGRGSSPARALGFAGAWVFLVLAPTSSLVPIGSQPMAENRMYLPLAGLIAIAVLAIGRIPRRIGLPALACIAAVLASLTISRNEDYQSALSLWTDTVAKCPASARARANLGSALYRAGQKSEAMEEMREATRLNPADPLAHLMLGNLLAESGRAADAAAEYQRAIQLDPGLSAARERLAALQAR